MKKFLLGSVALIALGAMPAMAADLGARTYTKAPAYAPVPMYNWTGFYVGGHVGGAFASDNSIAGGLTLGDNGQFIGGVQGGYDYQFAPNWVFGVEGQYSWSGNQNNGVNFTVGGVNYNYTSKQDGLGSATARLGYTWGPALLYVKGGYAFADYSESFTNVTTGAALALAKSNQDGYTVGAGLEYMFAPSWSAKVEYQYFDFGNTAFTVGGTTYDVKNDEHTVKAGLNYRFNWGGPLAAAKY
jgi:outer membrane immunogenic protein